MPRTAHVGPRSRAFGCSRWTTAGADLRPPPEHWRTPSVSAGMSASAATDSPPCSRSPWTACRARMALIDRDGRRGSGLALRMALHQNGTPLLSDSHFTEPDQVLAASSRPTPSSPLPHLTNGVAAAVLSHAEGTDLYSLVASTATSRSCGTPRSATPFVESLLQCPVDRRKERSGLRSVRRESSSSGVARRHLNQARRLRQTCVPRPPGALQLYRYLAAKTPFFRTIHPW